MPTQVLGETDAQRQAREREERLQQAQRANSGATSPTTQAGVAAYNAKQNLTGNPFIDWISGDSAKAEAAANDYNQHQAEDVYSGLMASAPSWEDLAPQYRIGTTDEYGNLIGGPSAYESMSTEGAATQGRALRALENLYQNGGYTSADRAMSQAMRAQQAQALGSANQAALQNMQARGMGASGAELAARMGAGEATNYANSQADAGLQMAAMQRMLAAVQGAGQLGTEQQSQAMQRAGALDAYNQANNQWRRDREAQNTGYANQAGQAHEQAWQNQFNAGQGLAGTYQNAQTNRRADTEMQNEVGQAQGRMYGSAFNAVGNVGTSAGGGGR